MKRREILEGTIQLVSSSCFFHSDYYLIIDGRVVGEGSYSVWCVGSEKRLPGSTQKSAPLVLPTARMPVYRTEKFSIS